MNCFFLSHRPHECAMMHCDQHVNKMILESAQILSTVLYTKHPISYSPTLMYKPTHKNHPTVLWASRTPESFLYVGRLAIQLDQEREIRRTRGELTVRKLENVSYTPHKSLKVVDSCLRQIRQIYGGISLGRSEYWHPNLKDECAIWSDPKVAELIKGTESSVDAYRIYYANTKTSFKRGPATWTNREKPDWVEKLKIS